MRAFALRRKLATVWIAAVGSDCTPVNDLDSVTDHAASVVSNSADLTRLLTTGQCAACDLRGVDLSGRELTLISISGSKLAGANLARARIHITDVIGNDFGNANLRGAIIWGQHFNDNTFEGAELSEAAFQFASGHGASWSFMNNRIVRSKLIKTRIETDVCYHSRFASSDLTGARLWAHYVARFCNVEGSTADGSDWQGWFYNQYFSGGTFKNATFGFEGRSLVFFEAADLTGARVSHSRDSTIYIDGVRQ